MDRRCMTEVKERKERRWATHFEEIKKRKIPNIYADIQRQREEEPMIRQFLDQQVPGKIDIKQQQKIYNQYQLFTRGWWTYNGNNVLLGVGIVLVIFVIILTFVYFSSTNCTQLYKEQRCWESSRSEEPKCLKLSQCIGKEGLQHYTEQLLAAFAAIAILLKKYWREIIEIIRKIQR